MRSGRKLMRYFEYEVRGHTEVTAENPEQADQFILNMIKESGMHDVTIFFREVQSSILNDLQRLNEVSEVPSIHRLTRKGN